MSALYDDLTERKNIITASINKKKSELRELDAALSGIQKLHMIDVSESGECSKPAKLLSDYVIDAIKEGARLPTEITEKVTGYGRETSKNSISNTLNRMKKSGQLTHSEQGWALPQNASTPPVTQPPSTPSQFNHPKAVAHPIQPQVVAPKPLQPQTFGGFQQPIKTT